MKPTRHLKTKPVDMTRFQSLTIEYFYKVILEWPKLTLICILATISFLGYYAKDFRLDASAETLVLENDEDLKYSRVIDSLYGVHDYLIMTYTPKEDLFSDKTLEKLTRLRDELNQMDSVESVVSILDVPLLESPPVPVKELAGNIRTLKSPGVDKTLAKIEFSESPLYRNLLVSPDLKTTALQINLPIDETYQDLLDRRNYFREEQSQRSLTPAEVAEFKKVSKEFQDYRDKMRESRHQNISTIRAIMDNYRQNADLFLGGVSMIADDMISFIKNDLKIFGLGILCFLIVTLKIFFKKFRWILLPMICCAFSAISMIGLLGFFGWEVTVISSNFISLQLIITMAIAIHLIVRYRELHLNNSETEHRELILDTVRLKLKPCIYAALTTIAGFGSLLFCEILPVITFGWMMTAGIIVSMIITFLLFPTLLNLMKKGIPQAPNRTHFSVPSFFARFTESHGTLIIVISGIALVLSAFGISRLEVENSFIDYFKKTTEIHQGMKVIDRYLGGTTPLDVIFELEDTEESASAVATESRKKTDDIFDEFDEYEKAKNEKKYWFTSDKMSQVMKIHEYLNSIPETGKVLSLGTMMKIAEKLNDGKPLDNFQLALLYSGIPDKFKRLVVNPFVSITDNQLRFSVRVRDSEKTLKRDSLLKKIKHDLINKLGLKEGHVHLTGMLVLYNNMLQSLFSSQIRTLGIVLAVLMGMFMILFRSLKVSLIAIFPNLLSIGVVLGAMGWLGIPLDMMTITIAAISVGIAVDDTIHYIHRFDEEFKVDQSYMKTLHRCHGSIGYAMYYTSVTIIVGFSILAFSNFIPSIYFGLLTGLAMLIALIAALTLLPQLIVMYKPFGPEANQG